MSGCPLLHRHWGPLLSLMWAHIWFQTTHLYLSPRLIPNHRGALLFRQSRLPLSTSLLRCLLPMRKRLSQIRETLQVDPGVSGRRPLRKGGPRWETMRRLFPPVGTSRQRMPPHRRRDGGAGTSTFTIDSTGPWLALIPVVMAPSGPRGMVSWRWGLDLQRPRLRLWRMRLRC